jgi:hypothetical protein
MVPVRWLVGIVSATAVTGAAVTGVAMTRNASTPPARIKSLHADVTKAVDLKSKFLPVPAESEVSVGNVIRTDANGFAAIEYPDGSIARVDANSLFTVRKLTVDGGKRIIEAHLDVGRTFHRVAKVSGTENRYEVTTPNAVAVVRGTEFIAEYDPVTHISTIKGDKGQVDVTAL